MRQPRHLRLRIGSVPVQYGLRLERREQRRRIPRRLRAPGHDDWNVPDECGRCCLLRPRCVQQQPRVQVHVRLWLGRLGLLAAALPKGRAWFDVPTAPDTAHADSPSARTRDTATPKQESVSALSLSGSACQFMACPGTDTTKTRLCTQTLLWARDVLGHVAPR